MKPLIGVTTTPEMRDQHFIEVLTRSFVLSVTQAGGLPVLLPSLDPDDAGACIERIDGLLLSGGGDVVPALYGQDLHPETAGIDNGRDTFERALIAAAVQRDIPILGVCRGIQILNVDAGGTLHQHLVDLDLADMGSGDGGDRVGHSERIRIAEEIHSVHVDPTSRLRQIVGADVIGVNTLHHQAIDRLAAGFVATAWSPDGIIEAMECLDDRRIIGVQWHPELLRHLAPHAALFEWLVTEAASVAPDGVDEDHRANRGPVGGTRGQVLA